MSEFSRMLDAVERDPYRNEMEDEWLREAREDLAADIRLSAAEFADRIVDIARKHDCMGDLPPQSQLAMLIEDDLECNLFWEALQRLGASDE